MIDKELGSTGVRIPELGIGTWEYHAGPEPLRKGLEAGAWFIDTAESYGAEEVVGQAIRGVRDRVFLATKVSPWNYHRADIHKAADGSLQRLGVDVIDLYQLHYPNPEIPIEETMGALEELVDAGKVRFIGVSNFSVDQLKEAQAALSRHPIVSNQVRYNIIDRTIEKDILPYCRANQVTVIAYSPLGRYESRVRDCDPTGVIDEVAKRTGKSRIQVILNWCLCKDGVVAIPKGNSVEHVLENCAASDWRLNAEQLALLDSRIQYRRRGRLEMLARQFLPNRLIAIARGAVNRLPRSVRRHFT